MTYNGDYDNCRQMSLMVYNISCDMNATKKKQIQIYVHLQKNGHSSFSYTESEEFVEYYFD